MSRFVEEEFVRQQLKSLNSACGRPGVIMGDTLTVSPEVDKIATSLGQGETYGMAIKYYYKDPESFRHLGNGRLDLLLNRRYCIKD